MPIGSGSGSLVAVTCTGAGGASSGGVGVATGVGDEESSGASSKSNAAKLTGLPSGGGGGVYLGHGCHHSSNSTLACALTLHPMENALRRTAMLRLYPPS
jgi:hypothetical protein